MKKVETYLRTKNHSKNKSRKKKLGKPINLNYKYCIKITITCAVLKQEINTCNILFILLHISLLEVNIYNYYAMIHEKLKIPLLIKIT